MPEVSNQGVRIAYDVIGDGLPLVLLHGLAGDRSWWSESGYVDGLRRDHRLINVDMRGHGESDKPHEPDAYRGKALTGDVLAVADAEGIDRFAVWGLSWGGGVAWMTANSAPGRVAAMITTGAWDPRPGTDEDWGTSDEEWLEGLQRDGMSFFAEELEKEQPGQVPAWTTAMVLRADPLAMIASMSRDLIQEGVPTLDGFPVPALLIAGELEDQEGAAAVIAGMLPNGESLVLPGLGHVGACARSDLAIPPASAFLQRWYA